MLPTFELLRIQLGRMIECREAQGHDVNGLADELGSVADSYDALEAFARKVAARPLRDDWPYVEPNDLDEIWAQCDPDRELGLIRAISARDAGARVEAAFIDSVCGCMLGKPLEFNPTMDQIRQAATEVGGWPLRDYVSEALLDRIGKRHSSWPETTRENIRRAVHDDDLNYTVIGMLVLERAGLRFTKHDVMDIWLTNLPVGVTFGPERLSLIKAAMRSVGGGPDDPFDDWVGIWQPGSELCGALIRADAYGYACAGRPGLAAELAWRDASWTHRRTGIYSAMFVAAAIACAAVVRDPMRIFRTALQYVPQRSRFFEIVSDCMAKMYEATDWLDGYRLIHGQYGQYGHCHVYQEVGMLINTLRFATDVGDGICKQVSQGADTDSFGATAGSLLGMYFGPGHLEDRWVAPLNDEIRTSLACFYERSLSTLAQRMGRLPERIKAELRASDSNF